MTLFQDLPLVYVASSAIHGMGLFARETILPGTYIGTYRGIPTQENGMHVLWIQDDENEDWIGVEGNNALRFLNHSASPNAAFEHLDLYALSEIAMGEEITFNYGDEFEEE